MDSPSPSGRIEVALEDSAPFKSLLGVAREVRDEGLSQQQHLALFEAFRERHASDADETRYDAVLDCMDFISGGCNPSQRLCPDSSSS